MRYIGAPDLPLAVSVSEFRRSLHINPDETFDDLAFEERLYAAQDVVESATGRPFSQGLYEFTVPLSGWRRWWFPCLPVISVTSLAVNDKAGAWVDQGLDCVRLVRGEDEPQLLLSHEWHAADAAADTLKVQAVIGGAASRGMRQAVCLLAREWKLIGDLVPDGGTQEITPLLSVGVRRLITQAAYRRPFVARFM